MTTWFFQLTKTTNGPTSPCASLGIVESVHSLKQKFSQVGRRVLVWFLLVTVIKLGSMQQFAFVSCFYEPTNQSKAIIFLISFSSFWLVNGYEQKQTRFHPFKNPVIMEKSYHLQIFCNAEVIKWTPCIEMIRREKGNWKMEMNTTT